ncbi:L-histidine N(alpha)-methyltransferase [Maribacter sp. 2304DJ31-5]|uniref:L-histidine N(alpha)-methyltransferase n=1 Tax=Maribacter sp. 2304DJ31-5 TaxID=3386273 RepID=UPI0039BCF333
MHKTLSPPLTSEFEKDVHKGLTDFPKHLSSKYFYDKKGDRLFQDIMAMPEYYLTNCEYDILETYQHEICQLFSKGPNTFNLIELGAGDGKKTKILLRHLSENKIDFKYLPIDISQNALDQLNVSIQKELPQVTTETLQGTYFEVLESIAKLNGTRKVILFLGSNIGNLLHHQAIDFLNRIQELMTDDDLLFMGFDQKKDPQTILDAYNDAQGITAAFNKNLLSRINSELDADFNIEDFLHWEVYDPETGTAKSYLVSKREQSVRINKIDLNVHFKQWETIHTEISQKYDDQIVARLAKKAHLKIVTEFSDTDNRYKNYVFKKSST